MKKSEISRVEARMKELSKELANVGDGKDLKELLLLIRRPGWTTPAEVLFVTGILETMLAHTKTLGGLKQALMSGSRAVTVQEQAAPAKKGKASTGVVNPQCRRICQELQEIIDEISEFPDGQVPPRLTKRLQQIVRRKQQFHCVCFPR
jgi:hypothetical protein